MMRLIFGRSGSGKLKEEETPIGPADPTATSDLAEAIHRNKEAIETLEKRQQHIEKKIRIQETSARERVASGDRRGALLCLRRKKLFEQDLEQVLTSRLTLETQIVTLEAAHTQQLAVQAIAGAAKAHRNFSQKLSIGKIDRLLDDIQEQQDLQQEVTQVLAQGLPPLDDAELQRELTAMEATEIENRVLQTTCTAPSVPVGDPAAAVPTLLQYPQGSALASGEQERVDASCASLRFSALGARAPRSTYAPSHDKAAVSVSERKEAFQTQAYSTSAPLPSFSRVLTSPQRSSHSGEGSCARIAVAAAEGGVRTFPSAQKSGSSGLGQPTGGRSASCGSATASPFSTLAPTTDYGANNRHLSAYASSLAESPQLQTQRWLVSEEEQKGHRSLLFERGGDRVSEAPGSLVGGRAGLNRQDSRGSFSHAQGPTLLGAVGAALRTRETLSDEDQLRILMSQIGP
ncbi:SNF7 family protein [Besnoitia besnoiti]|uniref:SNF7 family protein n=1 Tax=Besnoitia besnoiti TaxID=94643 RepID=A0A2A9MNM6_BESBE|nr:SNF7 family protein [Besnoitia besnoiti]PFH38171.1 SNF7 family protein [Besnoitia besnoiti]